MADRTTLLIVDALRRAAAEPCGLPLFSSRTRPGLFGATAAGKQAAARCRELTLVSGLPSSPETYALSEAGWAFLFGQSSPKDVLEELVKVFQARQSHFDEIASAAKQAHLETVALKATIERVLEKVTTVNGYHRTEPGANGWTGWTQTLRTHLEQRPNTADCPLPELFGVCRRADPTLTLGGFHDGLRRLNDRERVYLHPWTGPLHEIPEPSFALLVGHEIAYYASLRGVEP